MKALFDLATNFIPGFGWIKFAASQWRLILAVAICAVVGWFVWDWEHRGRVIAQQKIDIGVLEDNLKSEKQRTQIAEDAREIAVEALTSRNETHSVVTTVVERIENAPVVQDVVVPDVLDLALDGMRQLQRQSRYKRSNP